MNNETQFTPQEVQDFIRAEAIVKERPLSMPAIQRLGLFLMQGHSNNTDGLQGTLAYLRQYRLPKAKTIAWLTSHNITSDADLLHSVLYPIARIFIGRPSTNDPAHIGVASDLLNE